MLVVKWKFSPMRAKSAELPQIIEAARYGDSTAYDELLSRCYQPVLRYCRSMGNISDAEDLAQETFLRALKSKPFNSEVKNVEAFMIHIARFVCADFIRELNKTRKLDSKIRSHRIDLEEESEIDFEHEEILSALGEEMKEAFILTQLLGFSYDECAAIAEVPIGTVRSRVARARKTLQGSESLQASMA